MLPWEGGFSIMPEKARYGLVSYSRMPFWNKTLSLSFPVLKCQSCSSELRDVEQSARVHFTLFPEGSRNTISYYFLVHPTFCLRSSTAWVLKCTPFCSLQVLYRFAQRGEWYLCKMRPTDATAMLQPVKAFPTKHVKKASCVAPDKVSIFLTETFCRRDPLVQIAK